MQGNERTDVIDARQLAEDVNTYRPLLTGRQRDILTGVLVDERRLANLPTGRDIGLSGEGLGRRRLQVRDAQAGLVPMNLAGWIDHVPSNSECVLCHREYARLEGMGLLERHNVRGGSRTSHLRLTPAGRWVAEDLLAREADDASVPTDMAEPIDVDAMDFMPIEMPPEKGTDNDDDQ